MKKYLPLAIVLCSFMNDNPVERLGVDGPLTFDKTSYSLVWTDKPSDTYYIQEYLPAGEKVESFHQMLTIHVFDNGMKIGKAVDIKIAELEKRKKTDETCNYMVNENPNTKEYMVDFILGESKGDKMTVSEFNVYRYKQIELNKKKAILVYAYSRRAYGEELTQFFKDLKNIRSASMSAMINADMPAIQLNAK